MGFPSLPRRLGPFGAKSLEMLTFTGAPQMQVRSMRAMASSASMRSGYVMKA